MKKHIMRAVTFLLLFSMLLTQSGCTSGVSEADGKSIGAFFSSLSENLFGVKEQTYQTLTVSPAKHAGYDALEDKTAYDSLDSEELRAAYKSIEQSIFNITDEWDEEQKAYAVTYAFIPELNSAEIYMVKEAVLADHPEAFWITGDYMIASNLHDGLYVKLFSAYSYKDAFSKLLVLQQRIIAALKEIPSNRSEYERELIIHDMLIREIDYAHDAAEVADQYTDASTVYGALADKRAICSGYAQAFKLLCNRVGISCSTVTGISKNEGHMWNIARINMNWYHVDVTWDDPTVNNAENGDFDGISRYDYFNLTDKWISYDHTISEGYDKLEEIVAGGINDDFQAFFNFPLHECTSKKHNFYELNAEHITALNKENADAVADKIKSCCETGKEFIYIEFSEAMSQEKVIEWLSETVRIGITEANSYAEANKYRLIESCTRNVREDDLRSPWRNVYCIKINYFK